MIADGTPARVHAKKRLRYHWRIQKKWLKRFGWLRLRREEAHPAPPPADITLPSNSRRARALQSAARHAAPPSQEYLRREWERKLRRLCDDMIEECRYHGHDECMFNTADAEETTFIRAHMLTYAPELRVHITEAGVRL